jgi:diguanylate cyclase (GGDEF)-like protein
LLDFSTALVLCSSIFGTLATVLLLVWWRDRGFTACLWWSAGFAAIALGVLLLAARGHVPDFLSIECANTLVLAGIGCWSAGVLAHRERPVRLWVWMPTVAWIAGMFVPPIRDSLPMRMSLCNAAAAVGYGILVVLIWPACREKPAMWRPLALLCGFEAAHKLAAAVVAQVFPPTDLLTYPYASVTTMIVSVVLVVAVVYGARLIMERSQAKLRLLAYTDPLTRVLNRRGLIERLDDMMAAHRGNGRLLALLIFDLDHFKRVNDRHGHLAGDAALAGFARIAAACLRPGDAFGRLGGEEFAAVLPVSHAAEAAALAEHVRTAVAAQPVMFGRLTLELTVSIGIATMPADRADFDALMSAADRALYAAKVGGRNQTRTESSAPPLAVVTPIRLKTAAPV